MILFKDEFQNLLNCHPALVPLPPLAIPAALAVPPAVPTAVSVPPLATLADPLGWRRGQPVAGEELPEGGPPVTVLAVVVVREGFALVGIPIPWRAWGADLVVIVEPANVVVPIFVIVPIVVLVVIVPIVVVVPPVVTIFIGVAVAIESIPFLLLVPFAVIFSMVPISGAGGLLVVEGVVVRRGLVPHFVLVVVLRLPV